MAPPFGYPKTKKLSASGGFAPLTADQGLCPWTPLGPGPKKGFSCSGRRLRLATGRVQTAEWTNGHTVRYLDHIK